MRRALYLMSFVLAVMLAACGQVNVDKANVQPNPGLSEKITRTLAEFDSLAPGVRAVVEPGGFSIVLFPARFDQSSLKALSQLVSVLDNGGDEALSQAIGIWREVGLDIASLNKNTKQDVVRIVNEALEAHDKFRTIEKSNIRLLGSDYDSGWTCTAAASARSTSWQPGAKAEAWVSCSSYRTDTTARARARAGNDSDQDYDSGIYGSSAFAAAYVGDSYQYCTSSAEAKGYYWISSYARVIDALAYTSHYGCQ